METGTRYDRKIFSARRHAFRKGIASMKHTPAEPTRGRLNLMRPYQAVSARSRRIQASAARNQSKRQLIYVLMVPSMTMIFNGSVFGVALPTIRDSYGINAETAAWLVTSYSLTFMMFMPLYGRLGDSLGKRNLIVAGLALFSAGTLLCLAAPSLGWLLVGRTIQGVGVAGVAPLSMAIISERFPSNERGRALGTWNSIGPMVGIFAPLAAGLMVDQLGWRTIFVPVFLIGVIAMSVVWLMIPSLRTARLGFLRHFDWLGVLLLGSAVTFLVFFISSRPITGVEPLRDWRLLLVSVASTVLFVLRERRHADPFLSLELFGVPSLRWASIGSGLRMFTMSGVGFLMPLYLADVHGLSAGYIGILITINAAALLVTMRAGGQMADRWGSRFPVMIGLTVQAACMLYFALLPADVPLTLVAAGLVCHGLGAGLSLAALHRASMSQIPQEQTGQAAGIYSMIRFGGILMGSALGGVILQQAELVTGSVVRSYQIVFICIAAAALAGALTGTRLREVNTLLHE